MKNASEEEFLDPKLVAGLVEKIKQEIKLPKYHIMEICGGQTHAIASNKLDMLLPSEVDLLHGPGCPVCVTPISLIDQAIECAFLPHVTLATFGDMMRVKGSHWSLQMASSRGASVKVLFSPLDIIPLAQQNPTQDFVFFAIGFETTAPSYALLIHALKMHQITNVSILPALVRVLPAIHALKQDSSCRIDALLAAGHVCAITGFEEYHQVAEDYKMPVVVTGFQPVDILWGVYNAVKMINEKHFAVHNAYPRAVSEHGNQKANSMIYHYFEPCDLSWRGIGSISLGGFQLKPDFEHYHSATRYKLKKGNSDECSVVCPSKEVLTGKMKPFQCPFFGQACSPQSPLGAPMVSSEGVCAAYFQFKK